ncbi:MAG: hypothetical protein SFT81_01340 [Candidatus Caenarcaniphilales bacterium]|nr:hypothetical protein [Candidatus Caenarcaniphilales bacterium]
MSPIYPYLDLSRYLQIDKAQQMIQISPGGGDNSALLQDALNEAQTLAKAEGGSETQGQSKFTVSIGARKIRCDAGIALNPTWTRIHGTGGQLDFSQAPIDTVCLSISGNDDPQRGGRPALEGIMIDGGFGNQSISGRIGLKVSGAEFSIQSCRVRDFAVGIEFGMAYLIAFDKIWVNRCGTGIVYPSGLSQSGENISFSQSKIADCNIGLNIDTSNISTFSFYACSFDYIGNYRFGGAAGGSGTIQPFKLSATAGNNLQLNLYGCHIESWDYDHPPFEITGRVMLNLFGGKFLSTKSPVTELNSSSVFKLNTSAQSIVNIWGTEFENSKVSTTASIDALCEGTGLCTIYAANFKAQSPTWISKTSGSPNLDFPLGKVLLTSGIQLGANDAISPIGDVRLKVESPNGLTADQTQWNVNGLNTARVDNGGKIFATGLDARSQRITNVANATSSTDSLPKGQADSLYQPYQLPNNTYSADQSLTTANYFVQANAGVTNLTFYTASGNGGRVLVIRNVAGGNVNLTPQSGQTIGGSNPFVLANGSVRSFFSNGSNWVLFGSA